MDFYVKMAIYYAPPNFSPNYLINDIFFRGFSRKNVQKTQLRNTAEFNRDIISKTSVKWGGST
jgi:hypothetical protein